MARRTQKPLRRKAQGSAYRKNGPLQERPPLTRGLDSRREDWGRDLLLNTGLFLDFFRDALLDQGSQFHGLQVLVLLG